MVRVDIWSLVNSPPAAAMNQFAFNKLDSGRGAICHAMEHISAIHKKLDQLKNVLENHGVSVQRGSLFDTAYLQVELAELLNEEPGLMPPGFDGWEMHSTVVGIDNVCDKLLHAEQSHLLGSFLPHLRKIQDTLVPLDLPYDDSNLRSVALKQLRDPKIVSKFRDNSNKFFEVIVALAAAEIGRLDSIDDPDHAKGNNPDVLVEVESKLWALPCKTHSGKSLQSLFGLIEDGLRQLNNSSAERGMVVVHLRSFDHKSVWSANEGVEQEHTVQVWSSDDLASERLGAQMGELDSLFIEAVTPDAINALFANPKSVPGYLAYVQTAMAVKEQGHLVTKSVTKARLFLYVEMESLSSHDLSVIVRLQNAMGQGIRR